MKIGTDIIQVNRIENSLKKFGNKFLTRFLTAKEIQIAHKVETIAGFWAAKEAIAKALGCGIGKDLSFLDIEIHKDKKGAPSFSIDTTNTQFQITNSSLSISHDGNFAIAVVILSLQKDIKQ